MVELGLGPRVSLMHRGCEAVWAGPLPVPLKAVTREVGVQYAADTQLPQSRCLDPDSSPKSNGALWFLSRTPRPPWSEAGPRVAPGHSECSF